MRFFSLAEKCGTRCSWAVVAAVVAALLAGCGGGGGGGQTPTDTSPPTVKVTDYTGLLPATGGTATIEVRAADDVGIDRVEVKITAPNGQVTTVVATAKGSGVYSASYTAPPNAGTAAMVYKFIAYAVDTSGKTASDGEYQFQVASPDTPPPPPPFWI